MSPDTQSDGSCGPAYKCPRYLPFALWLAAFYSAWLAVVFFGDYWRTLAEHWGIAVAMAAGSYFAGSTPMGGGTVGFPVLVLLFDGPASLGRDFSFAIQSIGMVSASVFIVCRRQPVEWAMLRWAMAGSLIGTPFGIFLVAPLASGLVMKVAFAVAWASFGVLHLWKIREIAAHSGISAMPKNFDRHSGLLVGFIGGGFMASVTGVGIDMLVYAILVLMCRADLKIAIPTSVILMAFTSVIGLCTKVLFSEVQPGVFENWLAAAPVVALGAPFGALIVHKIGRKPTLIVVSILCILQFAWTMSHEWALLGWIGLALSVAGVAAFNGFFALLYLWGRRIAGAQAKATLKRSSDPARVFFEAPGTPKLTAEQGGSSSQAVAIDQPSAVG